MEREIIDILGDFIGVIKIVRFAKLYIYFTGVPSRIPFGTLRASSLCDSGIQHQRP